MIAVLIAVVAMVGAAEDEAVLLGGGAGNEAVQTGLEGPAALQLSAELDGTDLVVRVDGAEFTRYRFAPTQKYPYFWPVNGVVTGKTVTTETSEPYPHHHSLFFGCDRVNGGNYWQEGLERGRIASEGPRIVLSAGDRVQFEDACLWRIPGEEPVIRDTRVVTVSAPSAALRIIDFAITLEPLVPVTILKTNHALFSARVVPELSVTEGGVLVNSEGDRGEQETFGKPAPWAAYYGARDGVVEGVAIFEHPSNRWFPSPWFTRDYGFFSPTPMFWLEGDQLDLAQGEKVPLRYRVVVFAGDHGEANLGALYDAYAAEAMP